MGEFVRWLFVFAVLIVLSAVGGWVVLGAIQRSWRRPDQSDQHLPLLTHFAWDEPDIGPPSVSPEARAEVLISKRCGPYLRTVQAAGRTETCPWQRSTPASSSGSVVPARAVTVGDGVLRTDVMHLVP